MSSENSQVNPTSEGEEGYNTILQSRDPVEVNQNMTASNDVGTSQATEMNMQHAAASTLIQLHGTTHNVQPQGDITKLGSKNGSGEGQTSRHDEPLYGSNRGMRNPSEDVYENSAWGTTWQNPMVYSQTNMQNTISGLSNAIGCLQQQQVDIHRRQNNITGTLEQVLTALQDLRDRNCPAIVNPITSCGENGGPESVIQASANAYSFGQNADETLAENHSFCNSNTNRGLGETRTLSNNFQLQQSHGDDSNSGDIQTISVGPQHHRSFVDTSLSGGQMNSDSVRNHPGNTTASTLGLNRTCSDSCVTNQNYAPVGTLGENLANSDILQNPYNRSDIPARINGYAFNYEQIHQANTDMNAHGRNNGVESHERNTRRDKRYQTVQFSDACNSPHDARGQNYQTPYRGKRQLSPEYFGLKLPPFNGKEDWKVWINRFEAIAERRSWSEETKLDNLLPKLQGKAGDFVFTQLPRNTLACYRELVKELNSRFRVVETQKTFAAKFSQRVQRADETAEEYAADLKRLYAKAYQFRDLKTRQEDLVRRFLDGLRDSEARFEIEFHKEPEDIDEAVYHAVNFIQTRRRSSYETYAEKKPKKYARRANYEEEGPIEAEELCETDEELDRAYRVPARSEKQQPRKTLKSEPNTEQKQHASSSAESDAMKVLNETKELIQTLVTQMKETAQQDQGKKQQEHAKRKVVCYSCQQVGHFSRDCPSKKPEVKGIKGTNETQQRKGQHETRDRVHLN